MSKIYLLLIIAFISTTVVFGQQFTFQGKLYQSGVPVNGQQTFQFYIGNPINWSETQNVNVNNGLYAVVLGSINPLPLNLFDSSSNSRDLVVRVNGNPIDTVTIYAPFERDPTVPQYVKTGGAIWDSIRGKPAFIDTSIQLLTLSGDTLGITQGNKVILPQGGGNISTINDTFQNLAVNGNFTVYDTAVNAILSQTANTSTVNNVQFAWQSFIAPSNGKLRRIALYMSVNNGGYVTVNLYAGTGVSGQPITYTNIGGLTSTFGYVVLDVSNLNPPGTLQSGNDYTFEIVAPSGGSIDIAYATNNPYPYGYANFGPLSDLTFNLFADNSSPSCLTFSNNCYVGIGTDTPTSQLTVAGRVEDRTGFITPVGSIIAFAGRTAPKGWLLCDGSPVSRTTYAELFLAIDSSWGAGDHSITFNLPDARGRFLRGVDGVAGNDPDVTARIAINQGGNVGNNVGSLQMDTLKSHNHYMIYSNGPNGVTAITTPGPGGYQTNIYTSYFGGAETRPKNVYVNYIIKY